MQDLSVIQWAFAIFAALSIGLSKTGVPAFGILFVPAMAIAFPAKQSVGVVLPLLIVGDIMALRYYRKLADLKVLYGILPWLAMGVAIGGFLLSRLNDKSIQPVLGIIILALLVLEYMRQRGFLINFAEGKATVAIIGILAGCTTAVGNAAGPILGIYFLLLTMDKGRLMGTSAWLFFIVNMGKLPIFFHIRVIDKETLHWDSVLIVFVLAGALIGRKIYLLISQGVFNRLLLGLSTVIAFFLIYKGIHP